MSSFLVSNSNLNDDYDSLSVTIVCLIGAIRKKDNATTVRKLPRCCETFRNKFDKTQEKLQDIIACMDDLVSGNLCITFLKVFL